MRHGLKLFLIAITFQAGLLDAAPLDGVTGRYAVLQHNGDVASGWVDIISSAQQIGAKTVPLIFTSDPVPSLSWVSQVSTTKVTQVGDVIYQEEKTESDSLKVSYTLLDGYLSIEATSCVATVPCKTDTLLVSKEKSPGVLLDTKPFFESRGGDYKLLKAALKDVVVDAEFPDKDKGFMEVSETDVFISFSYCDKTCDPIYLFLDYPDISVYLRQPTSDESYYDIFVRKAGEPVVFYRWAEFSDGRTYFQNFQWDSPGILHGMEHEVELLPATPPPMFRGDE